MKAKSAGVINERLLASRKRIRFQLCASQPFFARIGEVSWGQLEQLPYLSAVIEGGDRLLSGSQHEPPLYNIPTCDAQIEPRKILHDPTGHSCYYLNAQRTHS